MEQIGLLKRRRSGKNIYYQVVPQHILFEELQKIILKTVGLAEVIRKALSGLITQIDFAFIYGSFATGKFNPASDIDLMLIGPASPLVISAALAPTDQFLKREINFSIFRRDEFLTKLQTNDHFITNVIQNPKIFIIGNQDELDRMVEQRLA